MENKNYSRMLLKWAGKTKRNPLGYPSENLARHISQIQKSIKFVMPDGGLLFDEGIKCVDILDEPIKWNLPFENILIEYYMPQKNGNYHDIATEISTRRIVLAKDTGSHIAMSCAWSVDRLNLWDFGAWLAIEKNNPSIGWYKVLSEHNDFLAARKSEEELVYDIASEGQCLMHMLSALTCKNIEITAPKRDNKKTNKGSLPFDEYRRFVVTSSRNGMALCDGQQDDRRGPREHLRRGHIRRIESGNIWINSTIVNPGASGKIEKQYVMRRQA